MEKKELIELGFNKSNKNGCIWLLDGIGRYDGLFDAYYYNDLDGTFTINSNHYDGCEVKIDDINHLKELLTALRIV